MSNLEQLKKEAREGFTAKYKGSGLSEGALSNLLASVEILIDHIHAATVEECIGAVKAGMLEHAGANMAGELKYWNPDEDGENQSHHKFHPDNVQDTLISRLQALITEPV